MEITGVTGSGYLMFIMSLRDSVSDLRTIITGSGKTPEETPEAVGSGRFPHGPADDVFENARNCSRSRFPEKKGGGPDVAFSPPLGCPAAKAQRRVNALPLPV